MLLWDRAKEGEMLNQQLKLERTRRVELEEEVTRLRRMLDQLKLHVDQLKQTQETKKKEPLVSSLQDLDQFLKTTDPAPNS